MRIIVLIIALTLCAGAQTKKFATDSLKVNGGLIVKDVDVTDFVVNQSGNDGFNIEILDNSISIDADSVNYTLVSFGFTNPPDVLVIPIGEWESFPVPGWTNTLLTIKPARWGYGDRYKFNIYLRSND